MAVTLYGIKNCDTMRRAFAWLAGRGIPYTFHDYKREGVSAAALERWCKAAGWEKVLNRAGRSFRALPDAAKEGLTEAKAIRLMRETPSMIKRPVLERGASLEIGFSPERYAALFA
ncbi:MAG: Spx/MgsR family RNA polymerase-binding regulatory protein [Alphaproteobacteria bacterium]|nr:Spx/MgsR family RNA polymerase-binding regulatory protein [Alphaproteobacteria bacterium]